MTNNYKSIISFDDENISLIVMNQDANVPIILYKKTWKLEPGLIAKCYVVEQKKVAKIVQTLLDEASAFVGTKLKDIYVIIDVKSIKLKNFQSHNVHVPNNILDYKVWNNDIVSTMTIDDNGTDHIFHVNISEWLINGKTYYSLDSQQHRTDVVEIKGIMYCINKVLHHQYLTVFESLKITPKCMIPFFMCYPLLVNSNKISNCETFVNLNNSGLVLTTTKGDHIISNICFEEFSLDNFFNEIREATKMSLDQIRKYFDFLPDIQNSSSDIKIANSYSTSYLHMNIVTNKDFNKLISDYANKITNFIKDKFLIKLNKNNNINISRLNLFPTNIVTEIIFKMMKPSLEIDNKLIEFDDFLEVSSDLNKAYLMSKYLINEQDKSKYVALPNHRNRTGLIRKD